MRAWLYKIRTPNRDTKLSVQIAHSILILLFGIVLGVVSKWLDCMSLDDTVWWQHILEILNLGNVFSELSIWLLIALTIPVYSNTPLRASLNVFLFFAGMCSSYHLYTIIFAGFNPQRYMMIWYVFTLLSSVLAFICWFCEGKTKTSLVIDMLILSVMMCECFSIGYFYFDFRDIINTLIFICSVVILYSTPKHTAISLLGAAGISFLVGARGIFFLEAIITFVGKIVGY